MAEANTLPVFRIRAVLLSTLLTAILVGLTREHVFFWDTIQLASKQADWFYQNDFRYLLLPERIDSGHPPGFGAYLAAWWTLLGRSLFVSHLAMAPWLFLFFYQLFHLCRELIPANGWSLLVLFVLANAVWWGQAVLVSPDVVLAALFVTGLRFTLRWNPRIMALLVLGLAVLSMRAMFLGIALFLWRSFELWRQGERELSAYQRALLPFLPGGLIGLSFLGYHYLQIGWVGYHADSPWAPAFARVGLTTLLRNGVILGWRLADYGHLFCWVALAYVGWSVPASRRDPLAQRLTALLVILILVLGLPVVLHQGLLNHRYFLPIYLTLNLLTGYLLLRFASARLFGLVVAGLLSGNLWLYPPSIAQGWDATPAHLPYYRLRAQLLDTLAARGIAPDSVGTAFPERGPFDDRDLSGRPIGFHSYELGRDQYILHTDVMNDLDANLPELRRRYRKIATVKHWWLSGSLYERKE